MIGPTLGAIGGVLVGFSLATIACVYRRNPLMIYTDEQGRRLHWWESK